VAIFQLRERTVSELLKLENSRALRTNVTPGITSRSFPNTFSNTDARKWDFEETSIAMN